MGKEITNPAYTAPPSNTISPYLTLVYHRDHLGSVRAITTTDGTILEQNDYYPFGLRTTRKQPYITLLQSLEAMAQSAGTTTANISTPRYLYNGKEKQEFIHNTGSVLNVTNSAIYTSNYIDYGARFYNPVTLRWNTQDPMAEKYQRYSPYNYCVNNPISFVDPNGMDLYLTGELAQMAFEQLQAIVKDYITLNMGEDGKITYQLNEGVKKEKRMRD